MGIVKASLEILGIGIGVKKVVLLMSATHHYEIEFNKISTSAGAFDLERD